MKNKLSPMMQQYIDLKEQYDDCILFFRLGDFYEMFFEDAKLASRELGITLTGRDCGQADREPMCGVPHHSSENYINKLINKGYKVAICEQVEDPKQAKGIVKREVVRIVTPGTNLNIQSLDESKNNYLMSLCNGKDNYGNDQDKPGPDLADSAQGPYPALPVCGGDCCRSGASLDTHGSCLQNRKLQMVWIIPKTKLGDNPRTSLLDFTWCR